MINVVGRRRLVVSHLKPSSTNLPEILPKLNHCKQSKNPPMNKDICQTGTTKHNMISLSIRSQRSPDISQIASVLYCLEKASFKPFTDPSSITICSIWNKACWGIPPDFRGPIPAGHLSCNNPTILSIMLLSGICGVMPDRCLWRKKKWIKGVMKPSRLK